MTNKFKFLNEPQDHGTDIEHIGYIQDITSSGGKTIIHLVCLTISLVTRSF